MAKFDSKCSNAPAPIVYLIERFVEGGGSLRDYPKPVLDSFFENFEANLGLFTRGSEAAGQRGEKLFEIRRVTSVENVPDILKSGDIVLGFVQLPPYELSIVESDIELVGPQRETEQPRIGKAMALLANHFWGNLVAKAKKIDPKITLPRQTGESRTNVGTSSQSHNAFQLTIRRVPRKLYLSIRLGLIDVAFPAAAGVNIWPTQRRPPRMQKLIRGNFGPAAVAEVGSEGTAGRLYLETVGRGLAYNILHEFWHNAEGTGDHPYESNPSSLVNQSEVRPTQPGLRFAPEVVEKVLQNYAKTWCRYAVERRVSFGEL